MKCVLSVKNRVRELRVTRRLTQAQLAEAVGVTRQTILSLEKARLNPSILLGLKIAHVLGVPVGDVFSLSVVDVVADIDETVDIVESMPNTLPDTVSDTLPDTLPDTRPANN